MWDLGMHGVATFAASGWRLRLTCQPDAVRFVVTHGSSSESVGTLSLLNDRLPALAESYIRGDELRLSMPPTDTTQAGLSVALLIIQADEDCFVAESTLSIETLLWDAYPTVELGLPGDGPLVRHTECSAN